MENDSLFETERPAKALAVMALPTIASQVILLIYNLADTWFIGRTNDPYMIGASSLALTVYLAAVALANVFGVGGGTLMVRLIGEKKTDEAGRVASYTMTTCAIAALIFSGLVFIFMEPLLHLLGAGENTLRYGKQYLTATTVIGGLPTLLSMCMPQLLRNAGYAKEAGFGVALGSAANILLDPLLMFVILPKGSEVLGAGIATALSNFISLFYFVLMFRKVSGKSVLSLPKRLEKIGSQNAGAFYSVGIPAAVAIFMFDLVTIVINRLTVSYGDIPLAAMSIVLKLERLPINIGLGVCLGMVPLVSYNFGAKNFTRMSEVSKLARSVIIIFSLVCAAMFWFFSKQIVGVFIDDAETVRLGAEYLRGRCLSLPFMMVGYHVVNFMNAVGKGAVSFFLALFRHLILIIPIMLLMNHLWQMNGLVWSQVVSDVLNSVTAYVIFIIVGRKLTGDHTSETHAAV